MNKRDSSDPPVGRGVLYPARHARHVELTRHEPAAAAAAFVEFYWCVRWQLDEPYESKVLSHPHVHLVFENDRPQIYGVDRGLFVRTLTGTDAALGVKFRPGAFRAWSDGPVAALADRRVPAVAYFGPEVEQAHRAVLAAPDAAAMAACAEAFLLPRLPSLPDPLAIRAAALIDTITADPTLIRVDQVADAADLSVRGLQRLFSEYVGVSPKWVLRRARLHEAAARAASGAGIDWAELAVSLGYSDQAHLTRDFTATIGVAPAAYVRS